MNSGTTTYAGHNIMGWDVELEHRPLLGQFVATVRELPQVVGFRETRTEALRSLAEQLEGIMFAARGMLDGVVQPEGICQ